MKIKLHFSLILMALTMMVFMVSCKKETKTIQPPVVAEKFSDLQVAEDFTWRTSMDVKIDLLFTDLQQNPVSTAFSIYDKPGGNLILNGTSDSDGKFYRKHTVPFGKQNFTVVIPGQSEVNVPFTDTEINNLPAYLAQQTIAVSTPVLKSVNDVSYAYYPSEGKFGTLCFEDIWPNTGDYDFNDFVIDYNVKATFDDNGLVTQINMHLFLRAAGANFNNGFGISFRQQWSFQGPYPDIASVTVNGEVISEEATTYPSYILIPGTKTVLNSWNTIMSKDFDSPVEYDVEIIFTDPISEWDMSLPLQNPFIFVNQDRGKEIHRPYDLPTSLANPVYAHTADDFTDLDVFLPENFKMVIAHFTYMTEAMYPWAIDVYFDGASDEMFLYPAEFVQIQNSYSSFEGWVETWDPYEWYLPEYRVPDSLYTKMPEIPYEE
jgi:LruC domain-containing protein